MFVINYFLFALFVFIVATIAAFVYLEWWQALLVAFFTMVLLFYGGKLYFRRKLRTFGSMFEQMFEMKSRVLRRATIEVHSVTLATKPEQALLPGGDSVDEDVSGDDAEAEEDDAEEEDKEETDGEAEDVQPERPRQYYCVDVTIIPKDRAGPIEHWDLDDLRLVDAKARIPSWKNAERMEEVDDLDLEEIEIECDSRFMLAEDSKFTGPQRLRFLVGVPPETRELKFHYYFEAFGQIPLPLR